MMDFRRAIKGVTWSALVAAVIWSLAGCASNPEQIPVGTARTDVLQALGRPTAQYPHGEVRCPSVKGSEGRRASSPGNPGLINGERLQYSMQPAGRLVYNVDLDANGRLVRAEQALNEALFPQRIIPNCWTRDDVLREYGPPARVEGVHNFQGQVWVWRYLDGITWRLLFIDVDPQGIVRGYSVGDEPLPEPRDPPR